MPQVFSEVLNQIQNLADKEVKISGKSIRRPVRVEQERHRKFHITIIIRSFFLPLLRLRTLSVLSRLLLSDKSYAFR